MAVKYRAYADYKTTHLGWLSEIPYHWEIKRLKYLGDSLIGLTYSPDDVVDEGKGTLVLRSSNVQNKQLAFDDNVYVNKTIPKKLVTQKGDILICARNGSRALIGKNAQIDENSTGMSFGVFMSIFRSPYNRYLSKVFNSPLFEYQSGSFLTATINQLTIGNLNSFEIPLPAEAERENIVDFLDHETAKLDALIEKQQQLIKLLKEKRQAVISHAVTKGLNPSAPMCDSGVEWLGQVPEHWVVSALKYHVDTVNGFGFSSTDVCEEGVPFIRAGNIKKKSITETDLYLPQRVVDRYKRVILSEGDIVISMVGSDPRILDSAVGQVGVVPKSMAGAVPNQNVVILREKSDSILKRFLFYILCSEPYRNHLNVFSHKLANQSIISSSLIVNAKFMLPSTLEQKRIIDFLDKRLDNVDDVVLRNYDSLEFLTERRTALISAAVTGKIDVRNWQAPQPSNKSNNNYKEVAA